VTDLKGKVALITGSARGIGKAIAERYGSCGASVVVNYARDRERANATVDSIERLGGTAIAIQADVSKVADIERLFADTVERFGRLAFFTLQNAARHVADNGRIIYVGSSNTAYPLPGYGLYGGSKIAPQFLVQVLAKELGARGIALNAILPTAIGGAGIFTNEVKPEFLAFIRSFRPMPRMGTVDDVANAAEYLASELAGFVSGQHLLVTGGAPA
jgi:3-oxoacyl-[acyl-carrier protein] reductase